MTTETEKVEIVKLEDVPGIGPVALKALKAEGFFTTLQVIHKNPTWLKDVTGQDKDKCGDIFAFMKKNLIEAGVLNQQEMSATQALEERQKVKRIQIGCPSVDHLLRGGIECGYISEIYGENGAGKTQFSHTLAIQVQLPVDQGGLAQAGKAPPLVLYIDTENTFRPERLISILAGKKLISDYPTKLKTKILENKLLTDEDILDKNMIEERQRQESAKFMDNIVVNRVSDAYQQCTLIKNCIRMVQEIPFKLIIVDSGLSLFRSSYLGRGNIKSKFDLENEMIHDLLSIAELNKIAVLFVNQIYNAPEEPYGSDPDIPYGGNIIGHAIMYRFKLEKSGQKHRIRIIKSPYMANDEVRFDIAESGIIDIT